MSARPEPVTDEELSEFASQFPAMHQPSDCIASVRRIMDCFASVFFSRERIEQDGLFTVSGPAASNGVPPSAPEAALAKHDPHAGTATAYTVKRANEIGRALQALPDVKDSRRRLTEREVVRHLAGEIAALQARGYTIDDVVGHLVTLGFEISAPTLLRFLSPSPSDANPDVHGPPSPDVALQSWSDVFGLPSDTDFPLDIDVDDASER